MIVKKITLGQIPQLAAIIKNIPQVLGNIQEIDNQKIVEKLPEIIEVALPEVAKLTSLVTDLTEEQVLLLGLDDFTEIIVQVLEINKVDEIIKNIKKAMALRGQNN